MDIQPHKHTHTTREEGSPHPRANSRMATLVKEWRCFAGAVRQFRHASAATKTDMTFTVYLPPQALEGTKTVPVRGIGCPSERGSVCWMWAVACGCALLWYVGYANSPRVKGDPVLARCLRGLTPLAASSLSFIRVLVVCSCVHLCVYVCVHAPLYVPTHRCCTGCPA